MCGITINSQEGSGSDEKINDLKLRDSKRAALVSVCMCMAQQYAW